MVDLPFFGSSSETSQDPRLKEYHDILAEAWEDGYFSPQDEERATVARERLGIDPLEHERILKLVHLTAQQIPELWQSGDVEALMYGLRSADAELHTACLEALAHKRDRKILLKKIKGPILHTLEDPETTWAHRGALEVIGKRPFREARDKVIEAMEHDNKFIRRSAAMALKGLLRQFKDKGAANAAVESLNDEDPVVRRHAIQGLRFMIDVEDGKYENVVAQQLMDAIDDKNPKVRKDALEVFESMGEGAIHELVDRGLQGEDYNTRRLSLDALGRLQTEGSIPYLVEALASEDRYMRWHAAKSLARFPGNSTAREALIESMGDEDPYIRRRAAKSLSRHGKHSQEALLELTRYGLPKVQRNAWRALSLMEGHFELVQPFLKALTNEEPKVRLWAVNGLGNSGDWSEEVLYSLKRISSEEKDLKVSKAAKEAIEYLDGLRLVDEAHRAQEEMDRDSAPSPEEVGEETLSSSGLV